MASKVEVENLLKKLNESLVQKKVKNEEIIKDIVIDLSEVLAAPLSPFDFQFCVSLLLGQSGLIDFCKFVASDAKYVEAKKSALDLYKLLLEKDSESISKYANELQKLCRHLYNADKSAKVKCGSLDLFCLLLTTCINQLDFLNFSFYKLIEQLCLDIKGNKGSLLLHEQLKTLGVLAYSVPEKVADHSKLIYKVLKDQLIKKTTGNQPDLTAATGAIMGLSYYFYNFPQGIDDTPKLYSEIYPHLHKLLDPGLDIPRRGVVRAALDLFHKHGAKFSEDFLKRYEQVFRWLLALCRSNKPDLYKAAMPAMDTFVVVIANILELQVCENKEKCMQVFQFLLHEYNLLLETESNKSSQISLSVKGYAHLAGPCRRFLAPEDIFKMFNRVLIVSQQAFFQSSEMLENKLGNLPSFVESLGIIISKMESITSNMVDSLLQLSLALTENFPSVSLFRRLPVFRGLFTLIASLKDKTDYFKMFLHSFVYQFILHTCSHLPVIETETTAGYIDKSYEEQDESKWSSVTGLKGELSTYKSFLPLWISLLNPEKASKVKVSGRPTAVLIEISNHIYSEFLECVLEIVEKLNLETFRCEYNTNENNALSIEEINFSDPISGLRAKTPKDFQVYINLSSLIQEVLPLQLGVSLEQHYFGFLRNFIQKSSVQPLVSTHYSVITTLLVAGKKANYFENQNITDVATSKHLLTSYILEILQRCKQYRDELLAACLTLIFNLPVGLVADIFPYLVPQLQMSLQLGLSYYPIAKVCISALYSWSDSLPKETVRKYFPAVLPLLLPYLRSQESLAEGEIHTRVISVKMSLLTVRRKVDENKVKDGKKVDISSIRKIQLSILQLLGHLDQDLCFAVIPTDDGLIAENAVAWDTGERVKFTVPFLEKKLDIYLDELLPIIVEKAVNSSDRQTKVAACELLHSLIILMIGTENQFSDEKKMNGPMAPLFRHLFKAMLKLSCDSDNVTKQLFLTLMYQCIHWFTNNKVFENPDSSALLQTILDGIITPNDPPLRDVSARYLLEFLKWSRKQAKKRGQVQLNLKSILKRIISFCRHPSAFKRLGGCLAWNNIYNEVREEEESCNIWMFEILETFFVCLQLCEDDDPLLGTQEQCKTAIKHVERVFKVRKDLFNKASKERRIPESMKGGTESSNGGTLCYVMEWLLPKIGSISTLVRRCSMELLVSLVPHAKDCVSIRKFIEQLVNKNGLHFFLNIIENNLGDNTMDVIGEEIINIELFYKNLLLYLKRLLAALDCYTWIISNEIASVKSLLSNPNIHITKELELFIDHYASNKIEDILHKSSNTGSVFAPFITASQIENLEELKCTVIIRMLDFVHVIIEGENQNYLMETVFMKKQFFILIFQCIYNPSKIGFNLKDNQVIDEMPNHLKLFVKLFQSKISASNLALFKSTIDECFNVSSYNLSNILPLNLDDDYITTEHKYAISGIKLLFESGCLTDFDLVSSASEKICKWVEAKLFKSENNVIYLRDLSHKEIIFVTECLKLAILFNSSKTYGRLFLLIASTDHVNDSDGRKVNKGTHVINTLGDLIMKLIIQDSASFVTFCASTLAGGQFQGTLELITKMLKYILSNTQDRQKYSSIMISSILLHWKIFCTHCGISVLNKEALLSLLMLSFLADREGLIKKALKEKTESATLIFEFFKSFLEDKFLDLTSKTRALKLLPFFLIDEEAGTSVKEVLQVFCSIHLPLRSTEYDVGTSRAKEINSVIKEFLTKLELTSSTTFLEFLIRMFCREINHRYDDDLQKSLETFIQNMQVTKQRDILTFMYNLFQEIHDQSMRLCIMDKFILPCLHHSKNLAALHFFIPIIKLIMKSIGAIVSGRSEEQIQILVSKTSAFLFLQVLYSKLPKEMVFAPGSEINAAYRPDDQSGKELTKDIFKLTIRTAKGELRHERTHFELRRKCSCSAYNTLIAVLSNVQDQLKFYTNFLFAESTSKDEAIFDGIIDTTKKFEFDIEISFNPSNRNRFVMVHQSLKGTELGSYSGNSGTQRTVKYMASHYLSDSSLREDISQYDFTNSVVLSQTSLNIDENRSFAAEEDKIGISTVRFDQSDFNEHEVMPNLTAIIHHMVESKIMLLPVGETPVQLSDLPSWMIFLKTKLETNQPSNVKLFILRLILNTERVFAPFCNHFIIPILTCIIDGTVGTNLNYFIADLMVTVIGWRNKAVPENSSTFSSIASRTLRFLISNIPHVRADIFKYNINMVKAFVENWKDSLTVPHDIISRLLHVQDGGKREVEAGLQISGIFLTNKLLPFDQESTVQKEGFNNTLIYLMGSKYAAIYSPAAEVFGLYLALTFSDSEHFETLLNEIVKKILDLFRLNTGQGINCLYYIHQHYPGIVEKLINKLLAILPQLYGLSRERGLHCLISYSLKLENIFIHLKEQNVLDSLVRKESKTQLTSLQLVNTVLPHLNPQEVEYFLPGISNFENHPAPACREIMYEIFIFIFDTFSNAHSEAEHLLYLEAKTKLMRGIKDGDSALKQLIKNFWIQRAKNMTLQERLLFIFEKLYSPDSEDTFLVMSTHLLLEATHLSPDFSRPIFTNDLTECTFREMKVSPGWKSRHASMIPLFAETQLSGSGATASLDALVSLTQKIDDDEMKDNVKNPRMVQATQQYLFSATQAAGATKNDSTYNWVTGATIDISFADEQFKASHPTQGSSSGLLFSDRDMTSFKRKGLGKSRMNPDSVDGKSSGTNKEKIESMLIRRRFVTNQDYEKQLIYFSRQAERKRKLRSQIERERKLKREAEVTMHRHYRVGELPDIQIPYKAIITPLQALAERDETTASQLFRLLAQSILNEARDSTDEWTNGVHQSINIIISSSHFYYSPVIQPLLELALANDIDVDPASVSTACFGSHLEPLGILTLERQLMLHNKSHSDPRPPARKKQRIDVANKDVNEKKTTLWLNIADLYKNLSMWDAVRGIIKNEIGDIQEETKSALEAESENNYFDAYKCYQQALFKNDAHGNEVPICEQHIWEEWFINCAQVLGQWDEIEKFVEGFFVTETASRSTCINKIWEDSRHISVFMPPLVNSKLMKILHGSEDDRGLIQFVNDSRSNPKFRAIMESELALQLSVLAVNQEKMEEAQSLLSVAQTSLLSKLAQCSLLTPKTMTEHLKFIQPLSELQDFVSLNLFSSGTDKITEVIRRWGSKITRHKDNIVESQFTTSYRDLYLHFLKDKLNLSDRFLINDAKIASHSSVVKAALLNSNPHLAHRHLVKMEEIFKIPMKGTAECQFYFLKTEASIIRASTKDAQTKLKYLVEAWSKFLGKVDTFLKSNIASEIEAQYLTLESSICLQICDAINDMNSEIDPQCIYIKTLAEKFPSVDVSNKSSWFKNLIACSYSGIKRTVNLLDEPPVLSCESLSASQMNNSYASLSSYYETCLDKWGKFFNTKEYLRSFITTILKGMALGSKDAHFRFPRLIHLIDQHPDLASTFLEEWERIPTWMFILWLSHILIYADKTPGSVLHPLILKVAKEYPQALIYPFEVSKQSFNFTGPNGTISKSFCDKVYSILSKSTIVYDFISAISLVHAPHLKVLDKLKKVQNSKDKNATISLMKECFDNLQIYSKSSLKPLKDAVKIFETKCGSNGEKLASMNHPSLVNVGRDIYNFLRSQKIKPSNKLSDYSPWLAGFNALNFKEEIEIPGQYLGHTKPMPEYHSKIASFNEKVSVMTSLRVPIKITINGSNEKEHNFLVKSGEDLRTDQRIESTFCLLNNIYDSHSTCIGLSSRPSLITYQVIPLSQEVGILEWVDKTQPLWDFINQNKEDTVRVNKAVELYGNSNPYEFTDKSMKSRNDCIKKFEECVNIIPWDLLRKNISNLAINYEGFFYLRSRFISSYATLSISHWLLGIGDRHLSNYLVNLKTGCIIGIDFGHHFESATLFLPVPELIPFRLTPQIVNVMEPLGHNGPLRETMIACLSAMKSYRQVLMAAVEAFVREPTDDWLENVCRQLGDSEDPKKVKQYSTERMNDFKKKLTGGNPSTILASCVTKNKCVLRAKRASDFSNIIMGKGFSKKRCLMSNELSAAEQVDILIEQATDPNILGRTWIGWKPIL